MKAVILCGGKGTRLSEETQLRPKPLVEVGPFPILWHIMSIYSSHGINEFVLALGYKGEVIKEYFLNYYALNSDFIVDLSNGSIEYINQKSKNWKIHLVDTGLESMTGGRLYNLRNYLKNDERFCLTYGDGVADVDITSLLNSHLKSKKKATVTAVRPPARFGEMLINDEGIVSEFAEKPQASQGWINGGFFIFENDIFSYLKNEMTVLEKEPLENLAKEGQLNSFKHSGFWQCMDTLRDKEYLTQLWNSGNPPWLKNR